MMHHSACTPTQANPLVNGARHVPTRHSHRRKGLSWNTRGHHHCGGGGAQSHVLYIEAPRALIRAKLVGVESLVRSQTGGSGISGVDGALNTLRGITCTARPPRNVLDQTLGERDIPWCLGYSMLTYCPHSEVEMTVAGTQSPFDRMWVTLMPARSHERDMGETVRGHSAVCAMVVPFTASKRMHFTVEQVGGSTKSPQYTHRARGACAARAHRISYSLCTLHAALIHNPPPPPPLVQAPANLQKKKWCGWDLLLTKGARVEGQGAHFDLRGGGEQAQA